MGLTLIIDADVLRYMLAFQNTKKISFDDDDEGPIEIINAEKARAALEDYVEELMDKFKADDFLLPLSVSTNFRKDLYPAYKANRAGKVRPELWHHVDGWIKELWADKVIEREYLEGDDIIGLLATNPNAKRAPGKKIVVSIDKDMRTLACRLHNPNKPELGTITVSQHDADLFWMLQTLMGDPTDNYPGCPGIGPKRADAALLHIHEQFLDADPADHLAALWAAVVAVYESKGLTREDAIIQAQLARILRHGDYDFKNSKVNLWEP